MREVFHDGNLPAYELATAGTICTAEEGKTRQSEKDSADINLTIKKYNLQPLEFEIGWSGKVGAYADISGIGSYQELLGVVAKANEDFMRLPPEIRVKFMNDPAVMLDAWNEGKMADVFEEIGWLERKQEEKELVAGAGAPSNPAP